MKYTTPSLVVQMGFLVEGVKMACLTSISEIRGTRILTFGIDPSFFTICYLMHQNCNFYPCYLDAFVYRKWTLDMSEVYDSPSC